MSAPYYLRPKDTRLPAGPDETLEPSVAPVDAERRSVPAFDWSSEPWAPSSPRPTELADFLGDLDPDIALWPSTILSRWPFTGPPTTGVWPLGWIGVDNQAVPWVCTASGSPGTWAALSTTAAALPGTILGSTVIPTPGYSTVSTTPVLVDGTGATTKVSFTVPPSGKVLLQSSALWDSGVAAARMTVVWSNVATNNTGLFTSQASTGSLAGTSYELLECFAQGLTPGAAVTAYLQWFVYNTISTIDTQSTNPLILKAIAL